MKSTLNYTRVLQQSTTTTTTTKKRINQLYPDQTPLYATSDQDVHGLGINLSNLGPTNRVDQNKKEEEENGCVQAVHSFITLSKATFDLLDTPTAPVLDVLLSQCIHTCHTNGLIIRLPLLMICVNCLFTAQRSVYNTHLIYPENVIKIRCVLFIGTPKSGQKSTRLSVAKTHDIHDRPSLKIRNRMIAMRYS